MPPTAPPSSSSHPQDLVAGKGSESPATPEPASVVIKPDLCMDMRSTIQMEPILERQPTLTVPAMSGQWRKARRPRHAWRVFVAVAAVGMGVGAWLMLGPRLHDRPWWKPPAGESPRGIDQGNATASRETSANQTSANQTSANQTSANQDRPAGRSATTNRESSQGIDRRRGVSDPPSATPPGGALAAEQGHLSITTAESSGKNGSTRDPKPSSKPRPSSGKTGKSTKHPNAQTPPAAAADHDFDALDFDPKKK